MKALERWAQNSTAIAAQTSKLTKVKALRLIPKKPIVPKMEIKTEKTQTVTTREVLHDPRRKVQVKKMHSSEEPKTWKESEVKDRYWKKRD